MPVTDVERQPRHVAGGLLSGEDTSHVAGGRLPVHPSPAADPRGAGAGGQPDSATDCRRRWRRAGPARVVPVVAVVVVHCRRRRRSVTPARRPRRRRPAPAVIRRRHEGRPVTEAAAAAPRRATHPSPHRRGGSRGFEVCPAASTRCTGVESTDRQCRLNFYQLCFGDVATGC